MDAASASYAPCDGGRVCVVDSLASDGVHVGICVTPAALGDPCVPGFRALCALDLECIADPAGVDRCTRPSSIVAGVGDSCLDAACDMSSGIICDPSTLLCTRLGDGTEGSLCQPAWYYSQCDPGLYCYSDYRCALLVPDGELCATHDVCAGGCCPAGASPRVCVTP